MNRPGNQARRRLPTSPFREEHVARPVAVLEPGDRVTHDRYGMGRVIAVEAGIAVLVDFGSRQERIVAPYAKMSRL